MLLLEQGGSVSNPTAAFDGNAFVAKRLEECRDARIIDWNGREAALTAKGRSIAQAFDRLTKWTRVDRRAGFTHSFRRE
jgi:hypothetical protein